MIIENLRESVRSSQSSDVLNTIPTACRD